MAQLENSTKNFVDISVKDPISIRFESTNNALSTENDPELEETKILIKNREYSKIKKLTPELAKQIAEKQEAGMSFDSLTNIDVNTIKEFCKYYKQEQGELFLPNIKHLDKDALTELATKYKGYTLGIWITKLDKDEAAELAKFGNGPTSHELVLWITELDKNVARELSNFVWNYGWIWFTDLKLDNMEVAKEFANFRAGTIILQWPINDNEIVKQLVYINELVPNIKIVIKNESLSAIEEQEAKEILVRKSIQEKCGYFGYPKKERPSDGDFTASQFYDEDGLAHFGNEKLMRHDHDMKAVKRVWKWNDEILPEWEELRDKRKLSFDWQNNKIKSWWQETLLESINADKEQIKLDWLDLELSIDEWIWLANLKNFVKDKRWSRKVEYKRDLVNKNVSLDKTLCLGNTMLITRADLEKEVSVCTDEEIIKKIAEWMNK